MYEGAIAYYRATGKRKWLDVAEKSAQHINKVFFEGDAAYNGGKPVMQAPGHEEIEMALIKLSQTTGNKLYAEMARKFIDIRGVTYVPQGRGVMAPSYAQQHLPVREQRTAEGHAVRAMYLYSGMADVVDKTLLVWTDKETAITRTMSRSGMSRTQVLNRMAKQMSTDDLLLLTDYAIYNGGANAIMPAVAELLAALREK
jgi:DUF1680 family protein